MRLGIQRSLVLLASLALAIVSVSAASDARAKRKSKSIRSECEWIAYDAAAQTVTVKVKKPGKGAKQAGVRKGKEAVFKVKAEGSVLTKTTVAVNGRRGELVDIPAGKTVNVYWIPKDDGPFARKIDVIFSQAELEEMYPDEN